MDLVIQEEESGCGAACVAMLAGIEYWQAAQLFRNPENFTGSGVYKKLITEALEKAELKLSRAVYGFGRASAVRKRVLLEAEGGPLLLKVKRNPGIHAGHWMVWDPEKKEILDPWTESRTGGRYGIQEIDLIYRVSACEL